MSKQNQHSHRTHMMTQQIVAPCPLPSHFEQTINHVLAVLAAGSSHMPIPPHSAIKAGTLVSIVLKQDQRTGRQVQGFVSQILTRGNHPHGVKVRLSDGRVGRVQQLVESTANTSNSTSGLRSQQQQQQQQYHRNSYTYIRNMDSNPWDDAQSQGSPYRSPRQQTQQPQPQQHEQTQYRPDPQSRVYPQPHQSQSQPQSQQYASLLDEPSPWGDPNAPPHSQSYSSRPSSANTYPQHQQQQDLYSQPYHPSPNTPPSQSRSDFETLVASPHDRAEQVEHMQEYEAHALETQDDRNRAQLEKEFPNVDGSLIAALYGEGRGMAETRELLQELGGE